MGLVPRLFRHWAIRRYVRELPRLLANDYGRPNECTCEQVRSAIERYGLSRRYLAYAMSAFAAEAEFEKFRNEMRLRTGRDSLRAEIADLCFRGDREFVIGVTPPEPRDSQKPEVNQDAFLGR